MYSTLVFYYTILMYVLHACVYIIYIHTYIHTYIHKKYIHTYICIYIDFTCVTYELVFL